MIVASSSIVALLAPVVLLVFPVVFLITLARNWYRGSPVVIDPSARSYFLNPIRLLLVVVSLVVVLLVAGLPW